MPALEQRRSNSSHRVPNKHGLRAHSRTASATKIHTMTAFTAANPTTTNARDSSKEKRKGETVKTPSPDSAESRSPSREPAPPRKSSTLGPSRAPVAKPPSSNQDEDDDESAWVSSESGAATPNRDASDNTGPPPAPLFNKMDFGNPKGKERETVAESRTPPATRQPLPPAEPFIRTPSPTDTAKLHTSRSANGGSSNGGAARQQPPPLPLLQSRSQPPSQSTSPQPPTPSRHHHHHHHHAFPTHLQKPHPLIRATSHTAPLASPSYLTATQQPPTPLSESPPPGSPSSAFGGRGGRHPSFSSARSVATLPTNNTYAAVPRERTLSSMSTASSSLAAIPRFNSLVGTATPTGSAAGNSLRQAAGGGAGSGGYVLPVSKFYNPGEEEDAHMLLRQPYLADHLSVLRYHDPLRDSARRVAHAKLLQQQQ